MFYYSDFTKKFIDALDESVVNDKEDSLSIKVPGYSKDNLEVTIEVPGYGKEDLEVTIEDGMLFVKGDNGKEKISKHFILNKHFEASSAKCSKGILTVYFNKKDRKFQNIEVE
jgi:HSP20 family molecular chaperone IbpA